MQTKRINVFDRCERQIRCVAKEYDYLGGGEELMVEEELEIGKLYTLVQAERESYGDMVFLKELPNDEGYLSVFFEELQEYDSVIFDEKVDAWLAAQLERSKKDIAEGRYSQINLSQKKDRNVRKRRKSV